MSGSAHHKFKAVRYFGALDGVRFLSIVAVVYHHTWHCEFPLPMFSRGFLGVDSFFVLSGFLIVTLLLREREHRGAFSLRNFYIRRTLRIFPLYYAVILFVTAIALARGEGQAHDTVLPALPYLLTYTYNWYPLATLMGPAWSLCVEEQFYLLWPPVEKFLKRRYAMLLLGAFLFVNQLVNFGVFDALFDRLFGHHELPVLDATFTPICLGVFLAHFLHKPETFRILYKILGGRRACLWTLSLLLVFLNLPASDIGGWPRLLFQLSAAAFLASLVIREDHLFHRAFSLRIVKRIGVISYGIYLYHSILRHIANAILAPLGLDGEGMALMLLTLALTALVSELSFRYFELPIQGLKDKLQVKSKRADAKA